MSEKVSICIVSNDDDWSGLYVNCTLFFEGHSIPNRELLDAIKGKTLADYEYRVCDSDWLSDHGNLPDELEHVRWAS